METLLRPKSYKVTLALIATTAAIYKAQLKRKSESSTGQGTLNNLDLTDFGALTGLAPLLAQSDRILSMGFLHGNNQHFLQNMLNLLIVGILLERKVGSSKFISIYLLSIIGGSVNSDVLKEDSPVTVSVGASGGLYGLAAAMCVETLRSGTKFQKLSSLATFASQAIPAIQGDQGIMPSRTDHGTHLGGLVAGTVATMLLKSESSLSKLLAGGLLTGTIAALIKSQLRDLEESLALFTKS